MNAKIIAVILMLDLVGAPVCLGQNANRGTWKLNEAKSSIGPGAPKNITVTYEPAGDDVKVTIDGVDKDGKPTHNEWWGKFDGKDYPVIGDANSDARSYTKIDDHALGFNIKKAGRVITSGRIVVSDDGMSRTVTSSGSDSKGKRISSTSVYDRQ